MKIAVFYYSQSGQALMAARELCSGMSADVVYKQIVPEHKYPFPWSRRQFFEVFPETRLGLPLGSIRPIDTDDVLDADLVMVFGQSWYLSPSLPLQSFFEEKALRQFLKGRKVVFVNVCRNMWLRTLDRIKQYVHSAGATLVGHIVLQDDSPNLISAVTIIRWLMHGKKEATRLLPAAGVSEKSLNGSAVFGKIIEEYLRQPEAEGLQDKLLGAGAIRYRPSVLFLERTAYRMFGFWAAYIRRKGGFNDKLRSARLNLFYFYLIFVLFVMSPFAQLFFYMTYPFRRVARTKDRECKL